MKMNMMVFLVFTVVFATMTELSLGTSLRGLGVEPRCRCIETESRRIGKLIESVALFPPTPHCEDTEIIATLKSTGQEICLDTTAPWVMKVIEKILANRKR